MAASKKPMTAAQLRYFGPADQRGYPTKDSTRAVKVTVGNPAPPPKNGSKSRKK